MKWVSVNLTRAKKNKDSANEFSGNVCVSVDVVRTCVRVCTHVAVCVGVCVGVYPLVDCMLFSQIGES